MIDLNKFKDITFKIHKFIPKKIREFNNDIEKNIRQILQAQLINLDLVSREEFDIQSQLLLRIREKLLFLEKRLDKLENIDTSK